MLILLLLLLLLFPSCSSTPPEREIYLYTVADDGYGYNNSQSRLESVISDTSALFRQIETFGNVKAMCFISENGKRYVTSAPSFIALDKSGNTLDADSENFKTFSYLPKTNEEEVLWNMKDVLESIASLSLGPDDIFIFTYSGHGEENTGSLITNVDRESTLYEAISIWDVKSVIESLGGTKILFIDACYSGHFLDKGEINTADEYEDEEMSKFKRESWWKSFLESEIIAEKDNKNTWIMTSSSKGQKAYDALSAEGLERQESFGAFTYYLLRGMGYDMRTNEAKRSKGRITFYGLYKYVRDNFPSSVIKVQTPSANLKTMDVVLFE